MTRSLPRIIGLATFAPLALGAQASSSTFLFDIGSSRMRFADSISATALSLSPALRVVASRATFSASGTFSRLAGASSNSGVLDGSLFTGSRSGVSAEVEGIAGGSAHSDGARTGQMLGLARMHLMTSGRGAWIGGGVGRTWDGAWRGVLQGDIGAWIATATSTFSATLSPTVVDDTIKYADAFFSARREMDAWELNGSLGVRAGNQIPSLPANRNVWGNIGAVLWASPRVGIAVSAGTYPVDFAQGFPGGQFVTLSMRFRSPLPARAERSAPPALPAEPASAIRRFDATRVSGDTHRVRVYAPNARSVELIGDFTTWTPVALASDGRGSWTISLSIPRGTHEVNVRVNGGVWEVPPGLASLRDEFGGSAGLLVVP